MVFDGLKPLKILKNKHPPTQDPGHEIPMTLRRDNGLTAALSTFFEGIAVTKRTRAMAKIAIPVAKPETHSSDRSLFLTDVAKPEAPSNDRSSFLADDAGIAETKPKGTHTLAENPTQPEAPSGDRSLFLADDGETYVG